MNSPGPDPKNWQNESGFLTDLAKHLVESRVSLTDDVLIGVYRELDAVVRLLAGELFWSGRGQAVARVGRAATVNYGQTPISKWGYIPPVEESIRLSCIIEVDRNRLDRLNRQTTSRQTSGPGLDLSGLDDLDF